jgi:hypothetical protein
VVRALIHPQWSLINFGFSPIWPHASLGIASFHFYPSAKWEVRYFFTGSALKGRSNKTTHSVYKSNPKLSFSTGEKVNFAPSKDFSHKANKSMLFSYHRIAGISAFI